MAIHDMWDFENCPQGVTLSTGILFSGTYNGNTIYNQYTGNPGCPILCSAAGSVYVGTDGFLVNKADTSNGWSGGIVVPIGSVQDFTNSTQYWIGFRTKLYLAPSGSSANTFTILSGLNGSNNTTLLSESTLNGAGLNALNVEHYVEVFFNRTALQYTVYVDGVSLTSGSLLSSNYITTNYFSFGAYNASANVAGWARGFRDFYFLDVDSTYTTRLGFLRAKAATIVASSGSEYVANGAADIPTAMNTAFGSVAPTMTPYTETPVDKQALGLTLSTTATDAGSNIIGVVPKLSFNGANQTPVSIVAGFQDSTSGLIAAGTFSQTNNVPVYNAKFASSPVITVGPNGSKWTAAEINQTQYVLTPQ